VRRSILRSTTVVALSVAIVTAPAVAAFAHVETKVGPYTVAIGFGTEPAYVGYPNSVEVIVHETSTDKGVSNAADTLKATVSYGSAQPMAVSLEPNFDPDLGGSPGDYRGAFVPTEPGKYTIHVSGTIGSTPVDETFTSSPTTFDTVTAPETIEYPTQNPTITELNAKLDQESARLATANEQVTSAQDAASTAKTVAVVALVVALVGLGVGIVGMRRRRT
jgi:hypothetical protein